MIVTPTNSEATCAVPEGVAEAAQEIAERGKTIEEVIITALAQVMISSVKMPQLPPPFFPPARAEPKEKMESRLMRPAEHKETSPEKTHSKEHFTSSRHEGMQKGERHPFSTLSTQQRSHHVEEKIESAQKPLSENQRESPSLLRNPSLPLQTARERPSAQNFVPIIHKPSLPAPRENVTSQRALHFAESRSTLSPSSVIVLTPQVKEHALFIERIDKDPERERKKNAFATPEKGNKKRILSSAAVQRIATSLLCSREQQTTTPPPEKGSEDFQKFLLDMMQDSEAGSFFKRRLSHFDVLLLFIEVMKLDIKSKREERVARMHERIHQIEWMEKVVKQYKQQASFMLFAGVGAGVLGIVAGALPIVGHMKGDWILSKLKGVFSSLEGMKRAKAFDNFSKIAFSISEMNKAMGQVQSSFCEGERSWSEHKANLHRTDGEESTRSMEEKSSEFKTWNEVLAQILRMEQDLVRMLYQG